jgi:hypothetical protein
VKELQNPRSIANDVSWAEMSLELLLMIVLEIGNKVLNLIQVSPNLGSLKMDSRKQTIKIGNAMQIYKKREILIFQTR